MGNARGRAYLAGMALAAIAMLGAPALCGASTFSGRLTGAPIPADGAGEAVVRAVALPTGKVQAAAAIGADRRYRLTVPAGAFALLPAIVHPGRPLIRPAAVRQRITRGKRDTVALRARATAVVRSPIVAIPDGAFTGGTGEFAVLNKGMGEMLITDLVNARTPPGCTITLREVSARFVAAYNTELRLPRQGRIDPATAVRAGMLLTPTRGIRGRIAVSGGQMTISAEIYRWSGGRTLERTSVQGPADTVFELEAALAGRLAALLCDQPPPISGTFSGSLDLSKLPIAPVDLRTSWSANVELVPQTTIGGVPVAIGGRVGAPVTYVVRSGTLTARLSGRTNDCTITGTASFDAAKLNGGPEVLAMSVTEGDPDTYRLFMSAGSAAIPTVLSECADPASNGNTGIWPLAATALMDVTRAHEVQTEGVFAGTGSQAASSNDGEYAWTWSLRG
ncbi:MAG: hypothetical protein AB7O78_04635 [Thermoleophilia bacterium]